MYQYNAKLVRVVDGDTVILDVDMGFAIRGMLTFRLTGVNTPERGQPGWSEATAYLTKTLTDKPLVIRTYKGQTFARWLCDVYILQPDGSLDPVKNKIVANGYGV